MAKVRWPSRSLELSEREKAVVREAQKATRKEAGEQFSHWMESQDPANLPALAPDPEPEPEPEPETTADWLARLP